MEEKNKDVKFEPQVKEQSIPEEDLKQKFANVVADNRMLYDRLKQANDVIAELQNQNLFTYISFLFKVVEHSESYSLDFVEQCISDIEKLMTDFHRLTVREPNTEAENGTAKAE